MSNSFKQREKANTTPFRGFDLSKRQIASRTSYAKVVYFHYKKQNFGIPTNLRDDLSSFTEVVTGVIDNDILDLNVSKTLQSASATFDIQLAPSKNWKRLISPGDWVMIYLYNTFQDSSEPTGTKNCVLIGNVDRVTRALEREDEDSDKVKLGFKISGRNFGKVFEETDLWFDPYAEQIESLDVALRNAGLELAGTPTDLTKNLLDIFLGKGGVTSSGATSNMKPWRIPARLAAKIKGGAGKGTLALDAVGGNLQVTDTSPEKEPASFYNILTKKIEDSVGYKARELLTLDSNGSLWDMVKRNSNELINEVYLEESRQADGSIKPTFFLKPRPVQTPFLYDLQVGQSVNLFKLNANFQTTQDLAVANFIEISPAEIKYEDVGKDDHSRMNMFWLRIPDNFEKNVSHMANMGQDKTISNPVFVRESIQRHGLKKMDQLLEFCRVVGEGSAGGTEIDLWRAFMAQLYDMHFANHLFDAGTISCTGVLEAELGKALVIKSFDPKIRDKVFYIEGYEHQWNFRTGWMTIFTVTHGQWKTTGKDIFIDASKEDNGRDDALIQTSYVAQTGVKR